MPIITTPHGVPAPHEGPWLFAPGEPPRTPLASAGATRAVLFDRDGTLVEDVPYNGDPALVRLMPHAREALEAVRARGVAVGVVSNQSGVARGLLTRGQVEAVRRRVEELLGPFGVWAVCPHGPGDGCPCRKPAPGLVFAACARLGAAPEETVVIGDIGADLGAARAAGARGVLVPTSVTRPEETDAAPERAADLLAAVRLALGRPPSGLDRSSGLDRPSGPPDRSSREDRRPSRPSREGRLFDDGRPSGKADGPSGEGSAA